jgi:hypothetical protein
MECVPRDASRQPDARGWTDERTARRGGPSDLPCCLSWGARWVVGVESEATSAASRQSRSGATATKAAKGSQGPADQRKADLPTDARLSVARALSPAVAQKGGSAGQREASTAEGSAVTGDRPKAGSRASWMEASRGGSEVPKVAMAARHWVNSDRWKAAKELGRQPAIDRTGYGSDSTGAVPSQSPERLASMEGCSGDFARPEQRVIGVADSRCPGWGCSVGSGVMGCFDPYQRRDRSRGPLIGLLPAPLHRQPQR